MTFAARFPGKCSSCGEWFTEGTAIKRDLPSYMHDDCDDSGRSPLPTVEREVCSRCWLEKSVTGECGCTEP